STESEQTSSSSVPPPEGRTGTESFENQLTSSDTKWTEYTTDEKIAQSMIKSNSLASRNVFDSEQMLRPRKPIKSFYTTDTYYTKFQDEQTEFVHSRKEVVTNLVDEAEMETMSTTASSSVLEHTLQSAMLNPIDLLSTSSSTEVPMESE